MPPGIGRMLIARRHLSDGSSDPFWRAQGGEKSGFADVGDRRLTDTLSRHRLPASATYGHER
ncbi:hypothetical protein HDE78_002039 [Rhodanobacter sp. K2T2]|nr:hypothetical protein [Rhodanobacter sp. K2T2]